jgi:glycosyltransferase involved in cell wall biosynthesis
MKVALVHDYLREYGGGERVLEALHAVYPDAPLYTSLYFPDRVPDSFKSWDIRTSPMQQWIGIKNYYLWYTYLVPWAFEQFDFSGYDVIISSSSFAAKGVITGHQQIHIDYCHTPTRFLWGLNRTTRHGGTVKLITNVLNSYLRQWDYAAAQRVDFFVANSNTVANRIKRFYTRSATVIYPPVSFPARIPDTVPFSLPSGYFLVVSRLERMKNIELLIQAFNELKLPLVIAGTGTYEAYLKSVAGDTIQFLGYVHDEEKAYLFTHALAFVASALDEDFGMTVPEAASYGTPVIAYKDGGYVETVKDAVTGVFFDTPDVAGVSTALQKFESLTFNRSAIQEFASQFSEKNFSERITSFVASCVADFALKKVS